MMNVILLSVNNEKQFVNVDHITSVDFNEREKSFNVYLSDGRVFNCGYHEFKTSYPERKINYRAYKMLQNEILDVDSIEYAWR